LIWKERERERRKSKKVNSMVMMATLEEFEGKIFERIHSRPTWPIKGTFDPALGARYKNPHSQEGQV
jgi:hypothetical protein